jgi:putative membrane protein
MMDGWSHDGVGWGGWIMMALAMVAFWGVVLFVVVALFRGTGNGGRTDRLDRRQQSPLEILDERFARGEIDEDEYYARQATLRAAQRGPVA